MTQFASSEPFCLCLANDVGLFWVTTQSFVDGSTAHRKGKKIGWDFVLEASESWETWNQSWIGEQVVLKNNVHGVHLLSEICLFKSRSCTPTTFKIHCKNDFSKIVGVYFTRKCYFIQKNSVETIYNQKLLLNFTNNYKEAASNTKLNINYRSRKTETVFSRKMYFSNLLCLLHRFKKKHFFTVYFKV